MNDLDKLLNSNLCVYNKCEVIEIIGFIKGQIPFNIFTIVVFEYTKQENIDKFITDEPQKIEGVKDIKYGINRRIINIDTAQELYKNLIDKNEFCIDKELAIGNMKLMPVQYVYSNDDMFDKTQINYILKNNFNNGSYLLELFDECKSNIRFLFDNPESLNSLSEEISKIRPIKIANISDRLGNVIFQFPINSIEINFTTIREENPPRYAGIIIEIVSKNQLFSIDNLTIRVYEENDNIIVRQRYIDIKENITKIELDDCFGTHIEIFDKNNQLLIYKNKFSVIKQMNLNMGLVESQKRVFELYGKIKKIEVLHNTNNTIYGQDKNKPFDYWIRDRIYEEELRELEKSKAFVQYYGNESSYIIDEKMSWSVQNKYFTLKDYKLHLNQLMLIKNTITKAIKDVRELINKHGDKGVYLWDPYLSADDIKNTLYFCKHTHVLLKAINGFANRSKRHEREDFKTDMIAEFNKDNKQFSFLNLEVRGKIGADGYKFHDRFLIFPQEKVKVWSLGISVNQLGKSHHILQEVKNAQHILNAFERLWDELNSEECLVWKNN